ncbi:MAG: acyl-CoA thioester hydrolase/BAAT C-terminal domain-containing protein [Casimicrobium sp.]
MSTVLIACAVAATQAREARTEDITTAEFKGRWYAATTKPASAVGILLIGGSEGELLLADAIAPKLAALGYPVLGVNYHGGFADRSRPLANVPLAQFDAAAKWMQRERGVRRVVVLGESRGSEAALLTALDSRHVAGVIAVVPSVYVWSAVGSAEVDGPSGWSRGGKPLPFVRPVKEDSPNAGTFTRALKADPSVERATIPIERIRVPVLMIGGDDDAVWPAGDFIRAAEARRKKYNTKTPFEALVLSNAGHRLLGHGASSPTETYAWQGGEFTARYGGTELGNARARAEAWRAMILFLEKIAR